MDRINVLNDLLSAREVPNYIHPFTTLSATDSKDEIEERILRLKAAGIRSMNLTWGDPASGSMMARTPFNADRYWERMNWVCQICNKHGMTFMLQDAAPFPTGQADGWFEKPDNYMLNKVYLAERHMDVKGPNEDGAFLIKTLTGALRGDAVTNAEKGILPLPGDRLIAVVAYQRENGEYLSETAVDLTDCVTDGILYWSVPEGIWRIFTMYETKNGGRRFYMNLLDWDSVALQIQAVHQPHYEHLKDELGKTWLGFFYDETEVGNLEGYFFNVTPGVNISLNYDTQALPWSKEMEALCRQTMGEDYLRMLPLLWFKDGQEYHRIRYLYMDMISKLIQENYNGQVHQWCKERGILYIGHNLEDENSHARLACGPVHYFRMQAHQDMAGVDLIGGQVMPGKDFMQAWYGCPEGDGEFYHYGLAKLASSAAHITPDKKGRSVCELLALYGDISGTKIRRYIIDHLLVNGVNNMIPADAYANGFDLEFNQKINRYLNRMCHLMNHTKAVIKTAVLYHAEAEWYQGDYQLLQVPARELAQNQISYDIIPADVFEDREFYQTDCSQGLVINGNTYEALIIPGCEAIPKVVADFIEEAKRSGFPVFYVERKPEYIAETGKNCVLDYGNCVATKLLAQAVKVVITPDCIAETYLPELRYNHVVGADGEFYMLHNEGAAVTAKVSVKMDAPVYRIDLDKQTATRLSAEESNGMVHVDLAMGEYEAVLLYSGSKVQTAQDAYVPVKTELLEGFWSVVLNGTEQICLDTLRNLNAKDLYPKFAGKAVYSKNMNWTTAPNVLKLGNVQEACTVYLNGEKVGAAVAAPYEFNISGYARSGENHLEIEVIANPSHRDLTGPYAIVASVMACTYNALPPSGLLGPVSVTWCQSEA